MSGNRLMITGSGGVLGRALQELAPEYPDYEFIPLTSKDGDLTDREQTLDLYAKHRPTQVIHLAAASGGIGLSMEHPASLLRDNILMAFNVLEAARAFGVDKTVMTLTTGMYPDSAPLPLNEDSIHAGFPHESNYGLAFGKRLCDPAVRAYRKEFGLKAISLIPNGIFGKHDYFHEQHGAMVPSLIARTYQQRDSDDPIVLWGDGSPLREYSYGLDLARIYMWALANYDDAQALNIGTTEENSIKDMALMIAEFMGVDASRLTFDTTKPNGVFRKGTDNSRLMKLFPYKYTPFREGIRETVAWYKETMATDPGSLRTQSRS